jgi:hypothetical protein
MSQPFLTFEMPAFNALKIARPAFLLQVDRADLLALFSPFADYFRARGADILRLMTFSDKEIATLGEILNRPDNDTPNDLVEALYMITHAAGSEDSDQLLQVADDLGIVVVDNDCPEQIAIKIWIRTPGRIKRLYAETASVKVRSFEYFVAAAERSVPLPPPSAKQLHSLEVALDAWFNEHNRGSGCKVSAHAKDYELWFLIRHGEIFQRVGVWQDGQSSTLGFRPDKYDVVVYNNMTNEIRINASSRQITHLYRELFGECFFGDRHYFPIDGKYTLRPILDQGSTCLFCDDVAGIKSVRMTRLSYEIEGHPPLTRVERAYEVFDALAQSHFPIPQHARLLYATFSIRFTGSRKERTVTIKPTNLALYTRDEDGLLINTWLDKRGFITRGQLQQELDVEQILAIA